MTTTTKKICPKEEQLKASLYNTLVKLKLSKGLYMNWNYEFSYPLGFYTQYVGDTRWNP